MIANGALMVDIQSDRPGIDRFLELPKRVYRGDHDYSPPTRKSVLASLQRGKFRDSQQVLMAVENGTCVARIVARRSPTLVDEGGKNYGMLGFFESLDRPQAVQNLFREAINWLKRSGVGTIIGPIDGDTWHSYRLNVGPFEQSPFSLEPYNPRYYAQLWEGCGFKQLANYYSKRIENVTGLVNEGEPFLARVRAEGYTIRKLDMDHFEEELRILFDLSTRIFAENFLFEPITWDEFLTLYGPAKQLLDPEFIAFGIAPDGNYAGFLLATRDAQRASANHGRINLKTIGVLREHRMSGLVNAIPIFSLQQALQRGCTGANMCLIRRGNPSGRMVKRHKTSVFRNYSLFQYVAGRGR